MPQLDTPKGVSGRINRNTGQFVDTPTDTPRGQTGTIDRNTAINSQSLATSPTINLTQPQPATQVADTLGYLDAFSQNIQAQTKQRQEVQDDSLKTYLKAALTSDTEGGLQDKLYAQNVDPLQKDLDEVNSQILAEQHALRRRVEAIRRNEQGNFGPAVEDMVNEAETESLGRQADLAVIQLSRQGKFDSAKAIADRAARAMFEKQEKRNEALKFNYEENKDLFTTGEKRSFEVAQKDRENKLDEERDIRMAKFQQTIEENDPLYRANLRKAQKDVDTPSIGADLSDAYAAIEGGADPTTVKRAFLQDYPTAGATWNNYFSVPDSQGDDEVKYPKPPEAPKEGFFGWGFLGL